VDRALAPDVKGERGDRIISVASAAALLQMALLYWLGALLKEHPLWTENFNATYYALSIDHLTTPWVEFLLQFPTALQVITFATWWFELLWPFLALSPWANSFWRITSVVVFTLFHFMGLGAAINLYIFPHVCVLGWFLFLPSAFWEFLGAKKNLGRGTIIYYDGDCGFCRKLAYLIQTF